MAESKEEFKSLLMRVKKGSRRGGLRLNIKKKKLRSQHPTPLVSFSSVAQSCPTLWDPMNHSTPGLPVHHQLPEFTAWQIEGEKVEAVTYFLFLGSKITVDSNCSHEIRRQLLPGRKVMTNLDTVLKIRDITLLKKVHLVKAVVFPVVMYGCESGTVKKAEHQRIDIFKLWCWKRLLKVPWTARTSNQSILREINPEYSLEGLMLKLKLQYFSHLMRTDDSLEKSLILGKIEGRGRRGPQRMRWLNGIIDAMNMNLGKLQEMMKEERPGMLQSMGLQRVQHNWATQQQSNRKESFGFGLLFGDSIEENQVSSDEK